MKNRKQILENKVQAAGNLVNILQNFQHGLQIRSI